jgi:hypothetical protein
MGNGLLGIILIGEAAGENHFGGHPIALGEALDILMRLGGVHVVDAQVEGGADFKFR